MSHALEHAADPILKHDSLGVAPVMGLVGPVPAINVGHLDVLYRIPTLGDEYGWLCYI